MRLPVVPQISTKDGVSNKNARLTNCLKESKKGGDKAVVRPGLVLDAQASGVGNGLVVFNNELVSVYGATLGFGVDEGYDGGWSLDSGSIGDTGSVICFGNSLFYILGDSGGFYTTTDLTDLVDKSVPGYVHAITGNILAAGGGLVCIIPGTSNSGNTADVLWSDDDGDTWNSELDSIGPIDTEPYNATVYYDGSYFICSMYDADDVCSVWRSLDCVTWTACGDIISSGHWATSFATGLGYTYAITSIGACAYTTNNGLTWTTHPTLTASRDVAAMTLSNSTLVAIGDIGGVPYIYRSTNGTTFSETDFSPVVGGGGSPAILAFGGGELVLTIYSSPYYTSTDDGASWTTNVDSSGAVWIKSAYGGGYIISPKQSTFDVAIFGAATSGTIPALATITGDYYDFAQSPL